jgi:hypothetical protein
VIRLRRRESLALRSSLLTDNTGKTDCDRNVTRILMICGSGRQFAHSSELRVLAFTLASYTLPLLLHLFLLIADSRRGMALLKLAASWWASPWSHKGVELGAFVLFLASSQAAFAAGSISALAVASVLCSSR